MDIAAISAHVIVTEISSILGQNVNLMDATGTIIASTDPARVGTFHGGAAVLVADGLPELVVDRDDQYPGARRGLNLPVQVDGLIQGVIGVTGPYDEVIKYGHVLRKMTEILVRENRDKQDREVQSRIRERFLAEWILEGAPLTDPFLDRGRRLGIEAAHPYRVAVGQFQRLAAPRNTPDGQRLIDRAARVVAERIEAITGAVFARTPNRLICLFPTATVGDDEAADHLEAADLDVARRVGVRLASGMGDATDSAHAGFLQADKALQVAIRRGETVLRYGEVTLDLVLDEVGPGARDAFLTRVFGAVPPEQRPRAVEVLEAYYEHDGSVQEAAAALFMHKNTLGARLDRLHALTRLNPRSRADGAVFQLAIHLHRRGPGAATP